MYNHVKTNSRKLLKIIIILAFCTQIFIPLKTYAQDFSLADNKTDLDFGSMLSNVLFSKSQGQTSLDGIDVSLDELARYPSSKDHNKLYGQLLAPEEGQTQKNTGKQLSTYLGSLYHYGYLQSKPINGEWGDALSSWATWFYIGSGLTGAIIYDCTVATIKWITDITASINIPYLFGYATSNKNTVFESMVKVIVDHTGFTPKQATIFQNTTIVLLLFILLITFLITLSKPTTTNTIKTISKTKNLLIRIMVVILLIPTSLVFSSALDKIDEGIDKTVANPKDMNSSYIVDTLQWATATNLNADPILGGTSIQPNSNFISKQFEPTIDKIATLNSVITSDTQPLTPNVDKDKKETAYELLSSYSAGTTFNVQDYFNQISALGNYPQKTNASKNIPTGNIYLGKAGGSSYHNQSFKPYLLSKNPKANNQTTDSEIKWQLKLGQPNGKATPDDITFNMTSLSPMSTQPVLWFLPSTYIYGAVTSKALTDTTYDFGNFINSSSTMQNLDPTTGEKDSTGTDLSEKQKRLNTNSLMIALMNKNAGINGTTGLSTQSTAFLLQSNIDSKRPTAISYRGYQTAPNDKGAAKNTGKNGNELVRYTIPAKDGYDYISKLTSLNIIWISAAIITIIALFTLFRVPLFASLALSIKGFITALFTGNLTACLRYFLYYGSMRFAFLFIKLSIYMTTTIATWFVDNGVVNLIGSIPFLSALMLPLLVTVLTTFITCYPLFEFDFASKNKTRKVSLLSSIILLPFLIAEVFDNRLKQVDEAMRQPNGLTALVSNKVRKIKHKEQAKQTLEKVTTTGAQVATGDYVGAAKTMLSPTPTTHKHGNNTFSGMNMLNVQGKIPRIQDNSMLTNTEVLPNKFSKIKLEKTLNDIRTQFGVPLEKYTKLNNCLLYTSPSPRDISGSRMPSSA